jgi:hypothetical protein
MFLRKIAVVKEVNSFVKSVVFTLNYLQYISLNSSMTETDKEKFTHFLCVCIKWVIAANFAEISRLCFEWYVYDQINQCRHLAGKNLLFLSLCFCINYKMSKWRKISLKSLLWIFSNSLISAADSRKFQVVSVFA